MDIIMILKAILIAVVEGITEFLPISSTGHMILVDEFVQLSHNRSFTTAFEVIIQLGAIASVVVYFWKKLWPFAGTPEKQKETWNLWFRVIAGVIPAVVLGVLFNNAIESLFDSTVVAVTLIFYGVLLIILERRNKGRTTFKFENVSKIPYLLAVAIGLFQCLAMVPGTSRSAATIIGAMLLGLSRGAAAEFSFFLAIPTMAGATMMTILKNGMAFTSFEWAVIGIGFLVAFLVAYAVIRFFMGFIQKHDFSVFGYYRILIGIIVLLLLWQQ